MRPRRTENGGTTSLLLRLAGQFALEPCAGEGPIPLDRPQRQAQVFCDFRVRHAGIEP